jgi:hypothetical protein
MEVSILEPVLTEVLEDQKALNQSVKDLASKVSGLVDKVSGFEESQRKLKIIAPAADTSKMEQTADKYFFEYCRLLEAQPKKIVRQFRLVLFPESNTDRYYKIVFGRLIPWTYGLVAAMLLISLGKQSVSSWSDAQERRYYFDVYKNAWDRLDKSLGDSGRQKMRDIMQKAVNDEEKEKNAHF